MSFQHQQHHPSYKKKIIVQSLPYNSKNQCSKIDPSISFANTRYQSNITNLNGTKLISTLYESGYSERIDKRKSKSKQKHQQMGRQNSFDKIRISKDEIVNKNQKKQNLQSIESSVVSQQQISISPFNTCFSKQSFNSKEQNHKLQQTSKNNDNLQKQVVNLRIQKQQLENKLRFLSSQISFDSSVKSYVASLLFQNQKAKDIIQKLSSQNIVLRSQIQTIANNLSPNNTIRIQISYIMDLQKKLSILQQQSKLYQQNFKKIVNELSQKTKINQALQKLITDNKQAQLIKMTKQVQQLQTILRASSEKDMIFKYKQNQKRLDQAQNYIKQMTNKLKDLLTNLSVIQKQHQNDKSNWKKDNEKLRLQLVLLTQKLKDHELIHLKSSCNPEMVSPQKRDTIKLSPQKHLIHSANTKQM